MVDRIENYCRRLLGEAAVVVVQPRPYGNGIDDLESIGHSPRS